MGSSLFSYPEFHQRTVGMYIDILQAVVYIAGNFIWNQFDVFLEKNQKTVETFSRK